MNKANLALSLIRLYFIGIRTSNIGYYNAPFLRDLRKKQEEDHSGAKILTVKQWGRSLYHNGKNDIALNDLNLYFYLADTMENLIDDFPDVHIGVLKTIKEILENSLNSEHTPHVESNIHSMLQVYKEYNM